MMLQFAIISQVFAWEIYYTALHTRYHFTCISPCPWDTTSWVWVSSYQNCTIEQTSVLELVPQYNYESRSLAETKNPKSMQILNLDLYYYGVWNNEYVKIQYHDLDQEYYYTSPSIYPLNQGFCDSTSFSVKTLQIQLNPESYGNFTISINSQSGSVGLKNIHFSYEDCHFSCATCSGSKQNQCLSCYYGVPTNGVCQKCPEETPYLQVNEGCFNYCKYTDIINKQNVCIFTESNTQHFYDYMERNQYKQFWIENYDPEFLDTSPKEIFCYSLTFGLFKHKANISRILHLLLNKRTLFLRLVFTIILVGNLDEDSGINFSVDNKYISSIYIQNQQVNCINCVIYSQKIYQYNCDQFNSFFIYWLYTQDFRLKGDVIINLKGNFTSTSWGIRYFQGRQPLCNVYCTTCTNHNFCLTCFSQYCLYDGSCYSCTECPLATISNSTHCIGYEQLSKYSKYYLKTFYDFSSADNINDLFDLQSQVGINFQKGTGIYTSYTFSKRIFGGPFVWANAIFSKTWNIPDPHFAITIRFIVIFGEAFTMNGHFMYQLENENEAEIYTNDVSCNRSEDIWGSVSKEYQCSVIQQLYHHTSDFTITVQCTGSDTNIYDKYCGISDYYIVVEYCQPYCDACVDDSTCTSWNSTYSPILIKFDSSECATNEYLDESDYQCKSCPENCLRCLDHANCDECSSNLVLYDRKCMCELTQYYDDVTSSCIDCQFPCLSCRSASYCTACDPTSSSDVVNGACVCQLAHFQDPSDSLCKQCSKLCLKCTGPSASECQACLALDHLSLDSSTCQCDDHFYFSPISQECLECHLSCQSCFGIASNQCLSCDSLANRQLIGLSCPCQIGFYEVNSICSSCPVVEDGSISECYKLCGNGLQSWHNAICPTVTCSSGFTNIGNVCLPTCGDGVIVAGEQCDDQNSIAFDGCFNCQFQCQEHCSTCNQFTSYPCPDICGDGITSGSEICDDGNDEPYDGCYNCQYQCQQECTKCVLGLCYSCNTFGWKVSSDFTCIENCGDGVIVNREQCEDNNTDMEDGCYNCRFRCRSDCVVCNETGNTCLTCLPGFESNQYFCSPICGDGAIVSSLFAQEQCDDSNTVDEDGCSSSCQWQCQPPSICIDCQGGLCQACAAHYQLNTSINKCEEICEDNVIVGTEECEDLNNQLHDGCYKCRFQCSQHCSICSLGMCSQCDQGYRLNLFNHSCEPICGDQLIVAEEECDDGNDISSDGCINCRYICQQSCSLCFRGKCLQCKDGFYLGALSTCQDSNSSVKSANLYFFDDSLDLITPNYCKILVLQVCYQCLDGWLLNDVTNECQQIENSYNNVQTEPVPTEYQKDTSTNLTNFTNCQFSIFQSCHQCLNGWQLDEITHQCQAMTLNPQMQHYSRFDSLQKHQLPDVSTSLIQCQLKLGDLCYECVSGWIFDEITHECAPISNLKFSIEMIENDLATTQEKGELSDNDLAQCLISLNQICYQCQSGWYLDEVTHECQSLCGDLIQVGKEECDSDQPDCVDCVLLCDEGCSDCRFGQCLMCEEGQIVNERHECELFISCESTMGWLSQYCASCNQGVCLECVEGWKQESGFCKPNCGDGIVVPGFEECDDGNDDYNDGCYRCLLTCPSTCYECIQGKCICNQDGWLQDEQYGCVTNCGDGIVIAGFEECDDGNLIPNDGCFNCQFNCCESCSSCQQGKCSQCQDGYTLQMDQCVSICGDGVVTNSEQCDDGNAYGLDGCSSDCQIEDGWVCQSSDDKGSTCNRTSPLIVHAELVKVGYAFQTVQIGFNQMMKSFKTIESAQWISTTINEDSSGGVSNIEVTPIQELQQKFTFVFYQVQVEFNQLVSNPVLNIIFASDQVVTENYVKLNHTISISLEDPRLMSQQQIENAQLSEQTSQIIVLALMGFGLVALLSNNLDLVSNLLDILQLLSYLSFINVKFPQNLQIYFNSFSLVSLDPVMKYIGFKTIVESIYEYPYFESFGKFKEFNVNAYFLENIESILLQLLFGLVIFNIVNLTLQKLKQIKLSPKNSKLFHSKLLQIRRFCHKFSTEYKQTLIDRFFMANAYDMLVASFLAFTPLFQLNLQYVVCLILSMLSLLSYGTYILTKFQSSIGKVQNKKDPFYEGLNLSNYNYWLCQYNSIVLFKKLCFCAFLVLFQQNALLQILMLSLLSATQFLYLAVLQPLESYGERIKVLYMELNISISILLMIPYSNEFKEFMKYENQVKLGWMHIFAFSSSLVVTLVVDVLKYGNGIIQFFKQKGQRVNLQQKSQIEDLLNNFST